MSSTLAGIRVLDLTNVLAGPFCAYQLALLGADVVKIEVPDGGDLARQLGADADLNVHHMGASFLAQNAGKRSVTLNLKIAEGKEVLRRLVGKADVLVENFRPGVMARLGLSYAGFRDGVVRGDVHDGNAFRRGGVSANAGLFGTAPDVWRLARTWLDLGGAGYTADHTPDHPESRGLAWQRKRGAGSAVAEMSDESFGHTGFTGTSVWVDPRRDRIAVLLTNRIHPAAPDANFHEVRKRFHALAWGRET